MIHQSAKKGFKNEDEATAKLALVESEINALRIKYSRSEIPKAGAPAIISTANELLVRLNAAWDALEEFRGAAYYSASHPETKSEIGEDFSHMSRSRRTITARLNFIKRKAEAIMAQNDDATVYDIIGWPPYGN